MYELIDSGFQVIVIGLAVSVSLVLLLGALYDFISLQSAMKKWPAELPHITVLIYVHENITNLSRCLAPVEANAYREKDVVVVDDSHELEVHRMLKEMSRTFAKNTRLYTPRKKRSKHAIFRQAYRRSKRGSFVLLLEPSSIIGRSTLTNVARYSGTINTTTALCLADRMPAAELSIGGLLTILYAVSLQALRKAKSVTPFSCTNRLRPGRVYSRATIISTKPPKLWEWYGVSAEVSASPRSRVCLGVIISMLFVAFCSSVFFQAAHQVPQPLLGVWLLVVIWTSLVVLMNEQDSSYQKWAVVYAAPAALFLLYAQSLVYLVKRLYETAGPYSRSSVR